MRNLSANWFAEGLIDLEYKQYILLAYLAEMQRLFEQVKVYPALGDLVFHYRNLEAYRQQKDELASQFPQRLTGVDAQQLRLVYAPELSDDTLMQEVDAIVEFALPRVKGQVEAGRELYEQIDAQVRLYPIGVLPLYRQEGYVLLRVGTGDEVLVLQYQVALFEQGEERLRGIHTEAVTRFRYSIGTTYETMKLDLIRTRPTLPNPATYAIESPVVAPLAETVLPIAKRRLLRAVEAAA